MKIKSLITHPMLYQPHKTFVRLRNTNEDIFDYILEVLDWNLTAQKVIEENV